jgi:ferric-dicitrate binding protein FerR (iron transport regulator)
MKNAMDKYAHYQTEDFLQDESFVEWVLNPDATNNPSWTAWIKANPAKKETVQQAINIIRSFNFKQEPVPAAFYSDLKNRIDTTITAEEERNAARTVPLYKKILKAAAIVAGILLGGAAIYYLSKPGRTVISTPYAAIRTVILPDNSEVVLNANSIIRFYSDWQTHEREVWVDGEAFFKIKPVTNTAKASNFKVHTDDATIEVLGTEFNIKNTGNSTGVMLRKGKVKFSVPDRHAETIMQPDDYCQYNDSLGRILTRTANPALYTSWMEHKYRFEETPAREICQTLKEYFGYDFVIKRPALAEQRISGTLELKDERLLMSVLSDLLGATVTRNGEKVIIE